MKTIKEQKETIKNIIDQACTILVDSQVFSIEKNNDLLKKAHNIKSSLEENFTIKVPLVGDFSAGKSSLVNAFLGRDNLLPTSVLPETAVSYELYYAPTESAQLFRDGKEILSVNIEDIQTFSVQPGDIVKVNIDNDKIKELDSKGITLVDMPGSDSGIEAHQKAIMTYIQEGTAFITLVDIEQGTIKQSNLKFIKEILGYNLTSAILLTKKDKKMESDQLKIKSFIEEQIQKYNTSSNYVGMVSALDGDVADFEYILNTINAPALFYDRYFSQVQNLLQHWDELLNLESTVASQDKEELQAKLDELKTNAAHAKNKLLESSKNIKIGLSTVDDICTEVNKALRNVAADVVRLEMNGDSHGAQMYINDAIRPVLINKFSEVYSTFEKNVQADLSAVNSSIASFVGTSDKTMGMISTIQSGLKTFANNLTDPNSKALSVNSKFKSIASVLAITTSVVAPWLEVAIFFGPEIFKFFFGENDKRKKEEEAIIAFNTESIPRIIDKLRPEIEKGLEEQRQLVIQRAQDELQAKCDEIASRVALEAEALDATAEEKAQKIDIIAVVQSQLKELVVTEPSVINC